MNNSLRLDVIIPTFNRCASLGKTLESLLCASYPPGLEVTITVVDNNSSDETREVVSAAGRGFGGRLHYLFEGRQGKSYALNTGIRAATGDLVGMIDDDERVDPAWFANIRPWFLTDEVDFIGGPYLPDWEVPPPAWLPPEYNGVIGVYDSVPVVQTYGDDHSGILPGGNAVVRRSIFERVGLYSTAPLVFHFEDDDMYRRLLAAGARGKYIPGLAIYHRIPASRLRRSYFRRWVFELGIYLSQRQRREPEPVPQILGVPRYYYGRAVRALADLPGKAIGGKLNASRILFAELSWWTLAGFICGLHFCKSKRAVDRSTDEQTAI
jgi:GT2 family glycosyltransferase